MKDSVIRVENLVKKFGSLVTIDSINFKVEPGEMFGFLGPNGAGKTTTINTLCTLLKPTSGRAVINGFDAVRQQNQVRQSIGLVFQDPSLDERSGQNKPSDLWHCPHPPLALGSSSPFSITLLGHTMTV